ncbi:hypothetical protein J3E72DRAFT_389811 [Bipolaris maydis]|nr:hypothetical protein J3E72DRAFT_389811 [Bipolaris maydis]
MEKQALGLKPANKQMRKELKNQSCSLLAEDVARLSDKTLRYLQEELGVSLTELRNALLKFAVDSDSLKSELVSLLHKHGPYVWGKEDRNHLLKPDSSTRYEKDLFYDDENDREITPLARTAIDGTITALNTQPPPAPFVQGATAYGPAVSQQPNPTESFHLLQYEVTASLLNFYSPQPTTPSDEAVLLKKLYELWLCGNSMFRRELGTYYDIVSKILYAWLEEREAIIKLQHPNTAKPCVSQEESFDRLLALNKLRKMRIEWKQMSSIDGMNPYDLLCKAFIVMTNLKCVGWLLNDKLEIQGLSVSDFIQREESKTMV